MGSTFKWIYGDAPFYVIRRYGWIVKFIAATEKTKENSFGGNAILQYEKEGGNKGLEKKQRNWWKEEE